MEWGILIAFFLLFSALQSVLAKAIRDDIAIVDKGKMPKARQRQAAQLFGKGAEPSVLGWGPSFLLCPHSLTESWPA